MIDDELMSLIACPICIGELRYEPARERLVCPACRLVYPVRDGIPVLLKEEALPLENEGATAPGSAS